MNTLKIAYAAYCDLKRNNAPTEHILGIVNGLAERGHEISLFVRSKGNRQFSDRIIPYEIKSSKSMFFDIELAKRLENMEQEFDVLYIRDFLSAARVIKWANKTNVPFALEHNGLYSAECRLLSGFTSQFVYNYDKLFHFHKRLKMASANIVVTQAIGDFFTDRYGIAENRIYHVPNGADINKFHPVEDKIEHRKKIGLEPAESIWFGYIGTMHWWNLLPLMLGIFETIAKERDDIRLFVGGHGSELKTISEMMNRSEFRDRIILKSPVPINESANLISVFDLAFAMMSPEVAPYGWQIKANNNAASGVPSLFTYSEQFNELFENGVAIGIKGFSPDAIAKELEPILDSKKLAQMGIKARKYVENNLTWDIIVSKTETILKKISGGNDE